MDLSQYKPSENFVTLFGELPTRTLPGESFWEMRARRVSYQQHVRDWDLVEIIPDTVFEDHTEYYKIFGLTPSYFTSEKRPGVFLTFKETTGFDIWESWSPNHRPANYVVQAQAKLISNGIKPAVLFPNPGLEQMYKNMFGDPA